MRGRRRSKVPVAAITGFNGVQRKMNPLSDWVDGCPVRPVRARDFPFHARRSDPSQQPRKG